MKALFGILLSVGCFTAPFVWSDELITFEVGDYVINQQPQQAAQNDENTNHQVTIATPEIDEEVATPTQELETVESNALAGQTWGGTGPGRDGSYFGRSKRSDWEGSSESVIDRYRRYV